MNDQTPTTSIADVLEAIAREHETGAVTIDAALFQAYQAGVNDTTELVGLLTEGGAA